MSFQKKRCQEHPLIKTERGEGAGTHCDPLFTFVFVLGIVLFDAMATELL